MLGAQLAVFGLVLEEDVLGAGVLFQRRDATASVLDAQLLAALEIGIEALAEGPHVHHEDLTFDAGHVLQGQHCFLGGIHAADGAAIVVVLVTGADALQEGDSFGFLVIRWAGDVASRRP